MPRRSRTRIPSAPARSRRSGASRRRTTSSTRTRSTGSKGSPKIPCLEYTQAASNDAALAADPERPGRLDAQLRPERRAGVHREGPVALPRLLRDDGVSDLARLRHDRVPLQPRRVPQGAQPTRSTAATCRSSASTATRRRPTRSASNGIFPTWVTGATKDAAQEAAAYNPTLAKKTLTDAGFTYKGSNLIDPKGNPVNLDIHVISGWSDWVASNQIITKNLQAIGINSKVALEPDWNSWYPNASATKFPTLLWQNASQGSPYGFFNSNMSTNGTRPSGQDATNTGNWAHYSTRRRRRCSNQWKATLDPEKQQQIARSSRRSSSRISRSFRSSSGRAGRPTARSTSTASRRRRTSTATRSSRTAPDNILSFTRICPGGKAGA